MVHFQQAMWSSGFESWSRITPKGDGLSSEAMPGWQPTQMHAHRNPYLHQPHVPAWCVQVSVYESAAARLKLVHRRVDQSWLTSHTYRVTTRPVNQGQGWLSQAEDSAFCRGLQVLFAASIPAPICPGEAASR